MYVDPRKCIAPNGMTISEQWIGNEVEGIGPGLICSTIPKFGWRNQGNPRKLESR
jgi:hypothetical protein